MVHRHGQELLHLKRGACSSRARLSRDQEQDLAMDGNLHPRQMQVGVSLPPYLRLTLQVRKLLAKDRMISEKCWEVDRGHTITCVYLSVKCQVVYAGFYNQRCINKLITATVKEK